MNYLKHLTLLRNATFVWIGFFLIGLPDYYQQYSTLFMIVFDILLVFPIWALGYYSMRKSKRKSKLYPAFLLSFYYTIPFFIYDYLYCGKYLGYGWHFVVDFWYLTVYHIAPWFIFIPTAFWLGRTS